MKLFERAYRSPILMIAFSFGIGMALGTLVIYLLFSNQMLSRLFDLILGWQIIVKILVGVLLTFLFFGIGGAIGGGLGGWAISRFHPELDQRRLIWRAGISFFIPHAVLVIPALLAGAVISFLNQDLTISLSKLPSFFGFFGFIYGLIGGFLLASLTVGLRKSLGITLASVVGFGLGGTAFGFVLRFTDQIDSANRILLTLIFLIATILFGLFGGAAIGFSFKHVYERRPILPQTRGWLIARNVTIGAFSLLLLIGAGNLISKLTIKQPDLASILTLPTQGTHWQPTAVLPASNLPKTGISGEYPKALCSEEGQVTVHLADNEQSTITNATCLSEPSIAVDGQGDIHVAWYDESVVKTTGSESSGSFIYESIYKAGEWTTPAIIATPTGLTNPILETISESAVLLNYSDLKGAHSLIMSPYNCENEPLTPIGAAIYSTVRQEKFRPSSDPIPYCKNRFDRLHFTPNPIVPSIEYQDNPLGAFDTVADLVRNAKYEVLFTTMQWDEPSDTNSPGDALAGAIADLYQKLKDQPENYPRGLTIRILLGNYPEIQAFKFTSQVDYVLQDLKDAGITEMYNDDLGWRLELANFTGAWPHAHSKFIVVDGKTAIAAGFNYSYLHLSSDHPSGQGLNMTDKGIQITGPVAQAVLTAYDDLWTGSALYRCRNFPPPIAILSFLWCDVSDAKPDHSPEVLRYFIPEGDSSNAFALHHTMVYHESDEAIINAILAAENSIDLFEVNFSLDTICVALSLVSSPCKDEKLIPPYQQALLTAIKENDVQIRAMVEPSAMNGIENRIAISWWQSELEKIGKSDNLTIKFTPNKMHDKAFVIDKQLLSIGSQNFHWSAWGFPSLTEYNIVTEDPVAINDFYREFETEWALGEQATN